MGCAQTEAAARSVSTEIGKQSETEEDKLYQERHNLMWRIAGFRPESLKERGLYEQWTQFSDQAFAFVKGDFARFFRLQEEFIGRKFPGDRSQFQPFVEKRLAEIGEDRLPRTKLWLYLCVAAGADDPRWARDLLRRYAANTEAEMKFVREVASELLTPGLRGSEVVGGTTDDALAERLSSVYECPSNMHGSRAAPGRRGTRPVRRRQPSPLPAFWRPAMGSHDAEPNPGACTARYCKFPFPDGPRRSQSSAAGRRELALCSVRGEPTCHGRGWSQCGPLGNCIARGQVEPEARAGFGRWRRRWPNLFPSAEGPSRTALIVSVNIIRKPQSS